jgi:hypothetical protein
MGQRLTTVDGGTGHGGLLDEQDGGAVSVTGDPARRARVRVRTGARAGQTFMPIARSSSRT